jgi:Predicted membrane protein
MSIQRILISTLIMAGVTYLVRMLPLVVFKKKITNSFVRSFLAYVPYAVLSAMTFPGILYSTGSVCSAGVGLLVALLLAYHNRGLLTVAVGSAAAVFAAEQVLHALRLL